MAHNYIDGHGNTSLPRRPLQEAKELLQQVGAEARRKRAEAEKALEAGHSLDSQKQTVSEYLEGWLEGPSRPPSYQDLRGLRLDLPQVLDPRDRSHKAPQAHRRGP